MAYYWWTELTFSQEQKGPLFRLIKHLYRYLEIAITFTESELSSISLVSYTVRYPVQEQIVAESLGTERQR